MIQFWYCIFRRVITLYSVSTSLLLIYMAPAFAQGFADISLEWHTSNNLPMAQFSPDQFNDQSLTAAINGGYHLQPGDFTGLNLLGSVSTEVFNEFTGLNNVEIGLGASISHKFGLGLQAPAISLSTQLSRIEFNNSIRDADNTLVTINLQKRFGEALNFSIGVRYENSDGDFTFHRTDNRPIAGNTFDTRYLSGYLKGEWEINTISWLGAGFELRNGDIVSTSLPYRQIIDASKAISPDKVFGERTVAYRIDARTSIYSFDYNRAIGERATWYAGLEYQDTRGTSDLDYSVSLLRSGFIYSF